MNCQNTKTTYYNAKPLNISNLGSDVAGAKRMNFDTYETSKEKEARKRKNSNSKELKNALKDAVLAETPDKQLIAKLLADQFFADHDFHPTEVIDSSGIISYRRRNIKSIEDRKDFNKMIHDYDRIQRNLHLCKSDYGFSRFILTMRKKYSPKDSFVDQTGRIFTWKEFKEVSNIDAEINFLKENASAVQFGNSVSDKERGYILKELSSFIKQWQTNPITSKAPITKVNWSFGARGNAQSVAYYKPNAKIISVNRNNIGSLIHELGHFLDYENDLLSHEISRATINDYAKTLPDTMSRKQRYYYCSRVEIFARAFEAYCYKMNANFSEFAQCGNQYLPTLNDELTNLIEQALHV